MTASAQAKAKRDALIRLVESIPPFDLLEAEQRANILNWLRSSAEIYRLVKPATPPKHLVVYAAIVDPAQGQCFLIQHRKAGLWLPTGGHVDPGEDPFAAAQRELLEETGRTFPAVMKRPVLVTVDETLGTQVEKHTDVCLWYAFTATAGEAFDIDPGESTGGAWFDFQKLEGLVCGPQVGRFIRKFRELND